VHGRPDLGEGADPRGQVVGRALQRALVPALEGDDEEPAPATHLRQALHLAHGRPAGVEEVDQVRADLEARDGGDRGERGEERPAGEDRDRPAEDDIGEPREEPQPERRSHAYASNRISYPAAFRSVRTSRPCSGSMASARTSISVNPSGMRTPARRCSISRMLSFRSRSQVSSR